MKTAEQFKEATGHEPQDDDLDRVNCEEAGKIGHFGCGWCEHGKPVFMCHPCFTARASAVNGHDAYDYAPLP